MHMQKRLIIMGCGGHARSVYSLIPDVSQYDEIVFVDENAQEKELIYGRPVVKRIEFDEHDQIIVAIGDNSKREKAFSHILHNTNSEIITISSSQAYIASTATIGKGCFVSAYAYLGPNTSVGENTIINTGAIVEHESKIGCNCHIAPKSTICGRSKIGNCVFIGAGATIVDGIEIADNVTIGAGSVVTNSITGSGVYFGCPARKRTEGIFC